MAPTYKMDYRLNQLPAAAGIRELCKQNFNSPKTSGVVRPRAPGPTYGHCRGGTDECFAGFA